MVARFDKVAILFYAIQLNFEFIYQLYLFVPYIYALSIYLLIETNVKIKRHCKKRARCNDVKFEADRNSLRCLLHRHNLAYTTRLVGLSYSSNFNNTFYLHQQ